MLLPICVANRAVSRPAVYFFQSSASITAMATAVMFATSPAMAAPDECVVTGNVAECSGDQSAGIAVDDSDNVDKLIVRALTTDIAPGEDRDGITFVGATRPIEIMTEADDNAIVLSGNADGIFAKSNGNQISVNNALDIGGVITAFPGTSMSGIRVRSEAPSATGERQIGVMNSGDISIDGRTAGANRFILSGIDVEISGQTDTNIQNSGAITVRGSKGSFARSRDRDNRSDRSDIAGILVREANEFSDLNSDSSLTITNDGEIVVENGSGIFARVRGDVSIRNNAAINMTGSSENGPSVYGIFLDSFDPDNPAQSLRIENTGNVTVADDALDGYGIRLEGVSESYVFSNEGTITLSGGYGIFVNAGLNSVNTKAVGHLDFMNSGNLALSGGANESAIVIESADFDIVNTGDITVGTGSFGISGGIFVIATDDDDDLVDRDFTVTNLFRNSGNITTTGSLGWGLRVESFSETFVENTGELDTSGENSQGMEIVSLTKSNVVQSGSIMTSGMGSNGVRLIELSYDPDSMFSDQLADFQNFDNYDALSDRNGIIRFTNEGTISASGDGADGVNVHTGFHAANTGNYNEASSFTGYRQASDVFFNDYSPAAFVINLATATITGGAGDGAGVHFIGQGNFSLDNAGTITALSGRAVVGGAGQEIILNSGIVDGSVSLAAGDDSFTLFAGGAITSVDGGDGDDLFALDGAAGTTATFNHDNNALANFERFEKRGDGLWTLLGSGNMTFPTVGLISGGTLAVNGSYAGIRFNVATGGRLGGSGSVGAVTVTGGTLAPGGESGNGPALTPVVAAPVANAPVVAVPVAAAPVANAPTSAPQPLPPVLSAAQLATLGRVATSESAQQGGMITGGQNAPHAQMNLGGESAPHTTMILGGENVPHADMLIGGENIAFSDESLIPGTVNVPHRQLISGGENISLAAGQNIGTLTINGDLSFNASSFFEVEVDDQGNGDRVVVLGSVNLGNATLRVFDMLGGGFAGDDPFNYLIIDNDAMDAVNGIFGSFTNELAFLTPTVRYDAGDGNDVQLTLTPNNAPPPPSPPPTPTPTPTPVPTPTPTPVPTPTPTPTPVPTPTPTPGPLFPTVAKTFNQTGAAVALDGFDRTSGSDADTVYMNVLFSTVPGALRAFDTSSGEIYATLLAGSLDDGMARTDRLVARSHEAFADGWGMWGGINGRTGSIDGDANAAFATQDGYGFDLGIDYRGAGNAWAIGASFVYLNSDLEVLDRNSRSDGDGWQVGGYGRYGSGGKGVTATAAVSYTNSAADITRGITVNSLSRTATGSVDIDTFAVKGELRYGVEMAMGWSFGPVVALHYASSDLGRFAENGAQSLNLSSKGATDKRTRYGGGIFANWQGSKGGLDASAQYVGGKSNVAEVGTALAGAPGITTPVRSPLTDASGGLFTVSGEYKLGGNWTIGGSIRSLITKDEKSASGSVTVGWKF